MKQIRFLLITLFFTAAGLSLYAKPQIKLKASQEQYFEDTRETGLSPSKDGIYPVRLTITIDSNDRTLYVKIYRSENPNGPFYLIIDAMQPNEEYFNLYDSEPSKPGQKYYYKAVLGKTNLNTAELDQISNIACGWGALTHEAFYVYFNNTISRSYKKMTLMNKPMALSKLGTEETTGDKSGTFKYNAKVKGMGGLATMSYQNYSDDGIVYFTGDMITKADMTSSGNMDGSMNLSGMYNGTISFENVQIKNSKASGGTYTVTPKNTPTKAISYTWTFVYYE